MERQDRWRDLSQPFRLAAVWAHADRVADILLAATEQPDKVGPTIDGWHPRGFVPWLLRDPADEGEPSSPSVASPQALLLGVLGFALGDEADVLLSEEQRDTVLACVSNKSGDGGRWPHAKTSWPDEGPDALGSFLGKDHPHLRSSLDVGGLGERLSPDFARIVATQAFEALAEDPGDVGAWKLLLIARRHRIAPDEREHAEDLLRRLDLRAMALAEEQTARAVARWSARIGRLLDNEAVTSAVGAQLVAFSSAARGRTGTPVQDAGRADAATGFVSLVGDAAAQLCRGPGAATVGEGLARVARALVADCPEAAGFWREVLERLVREFPYVATAPLWPLLLQLRARPDLQALGGDGA